MPLRLSFSFFLSQYYALLIGFLLLLILGNSNAQTVTSLEQLFQTLPPTYLQEKLREGTKRYRTGKVREAFLILQHSFFLLKISDATDNSSSSHFSNHYSQQLQTQIRRGLLKTILQLTQEWSKKEHLSDALLLLQQYDQGSCDLHSSELLQREHKLQQKCITQHNSFSFFPSVITEQQISKANNNLLQGNLEAAQQLYQELSSATPNNLYFLLQLSAISYSQQEKTLFLKKEEQYSLQENVEEAWNLPPSPLPSNDDSQQEKNSEKASDTSPQERFPQQELAEKLETTILPTINFSDTTLHDTLQQLQKEAAKVLSSSTNTPINIILEHPNSPRYQQPNINLTLHQIPLGEALHYLAETANLSIRLDRYAVIFFNPQEGGEPWETKTYQLPQEFFQTLYDKLDEKFDEKFNDKQNNIFQNPAETTVNKNDHQTPNTVETPSSLLRNYFIKEGISFPAGSELHYLPENQLLLVKNHPTSLSLLEELLPHETHLQLPQVEIETRFLEVAQSQLERLGVDWSLLNQTSTIHAGNPSSEEKIGSEKTLSHLAEMLQKTLLTPAQATPASFFSLSGIFQETEFHLILQALHQLEGSNLLSAPKVTTMSGKEATIRVGEEFPYPTDYAPPQVPQSQGATMNPAIPATATSFETRQVGVTLKVTPYIAPNHQRVTLQLTPQVVHFEGFLNYGNPIYTKAPLFLGLGEDQIVAGTAPILLTENPINQPIFSSSQVQTEISLHDGETLLLGGLMREEISQTTNQLPLTSLLPFNGLGETASLLNPLFRSTNKQQKKRNLLIFVTIHLH